MVLCSGLGCVGMLTAFGNVTFTVFVITGMVMRKMMSSTSITSTSGVVLMVAITLTSPPPPEPTLMAMASPPSAGVSLADRRRLGAGRPRPAAFAADSGSAHQVGMQVGGKVPQRVLEDLVATEQPVVTHDRGHRDEQPDGRHDERLADGTGHLVDARLPGDADIHQGAQNAPHRAEQPDEGGDRADGGEEPQPVVELAVHLLHRALQRHRDPLVQVDAVGKAPVVMRGGAQPVLRDAAEVIALLQPVDTVLNGGRAPELLLDHPRGLLELALVPQLREHHVPG